MKNKNIYMALIACLFSYNFIAAGLKNACKQRLNDFKTASSNGYVAKTLLRSRMLVDFVGYCKIAGKNKYGGDEPVVDDVLGHLETDEEKKAVVYYALRSLGNDINDIKKRLYNTGFDNLKSLDGKDILALIKSYESAKKEALKKIKTSKKCKQIEDKKQKLKKIKMPTTRIWFN